MQDERSDPEANCGSRVTSEVLGVGSQRVLRPFMAALVFMLAACGGKSAGKIAGEHRAASSTKLGKIAALAKAAEKLPALKSDEWKLPAGLKLNFVPFAETSPVVGEPEPNPDYNTALAFDKHLAQPSRAESIEWRSGSNDIFLLLIDRSDLWLIEPACILETGKGRYGSEPDVDNLIRGFHWLERTRYLLVLRLRTILPPGLIMKELEERDMKSFEGGRVEGDAVLFDIETGDSLGGIVIDVTSPSTAEVRKSDVHGQLRRLLADAVEKSLKEKLAAVGVPPR